MGITNNRDATRTQSFTYGPLNRLVTAQTQGTAGPDCFGFQFTYDAWTNLTGTSILSGYTSCSVTTPYAFSVAVNGNNQITSSGFGYDATGNLLTDGINSYAWNAESEIKSAAGVGYTYDGDGNRLDKCTLSGGQCSTITKYYWYGAGTEILDEMDNTGAFTNEYVFFGGKRVAMRDVHSGNIYYYAGDMLGSARTMVQAGQTWVCFDADFLPFGQEVDYTSTCGSNYKFEGKERDTETGNDDFGARYYRSALGRWLSPDWSAIPAPVPYANLTNPQTLNLYAMVSDNPETFADLDGHCSMDQEVCDTNPSNGETANQASTKKNVCNNETGKCDNANTNVNGKEAKKPKKKPTFWERLKSLFRETQAARQKADDWMARHPNVQAMVMIAVIIASHGEGAEGEEEPGEAVPGEPTSPNQMNMQVMRGQAPDSVARVDLPRAPYEKPHIEFKDGSALNNDGTWKHGGRPLTNAEKEWIIVNGWKLPKE